MQKSRKFPKRIRLCHQLSFPCKTVLTRDLTFETMKMKLFYFRFTKICKCGFDYWCCSSISKSYNWVWFITYLVLCTSKVFRLDVELWYDILWRQNLKTVTKTHTKYPQECPLLFMLFRIWWFTSVRSERGYCHVENCLPQFKLWVA